MYRRQLSLELEKRIKEPRSFIQIVIGPRQTGKTTAVRQAVENSGQPVHFANADGPFVFSSEWLESEWEKGRFLAEEAKAQDSEAGAILVIDEIQKIEQWSSVVKMLWDQDAWNKLNLKVILTGSSSLLLRKGMAESLMGRFELLHCTHWCLDECKEAFGYKLEDFLYFGGYPGSAKFFEEPDRWFSYMRDSIVEPTVSQDILQVELVKKPALLRALFLMGARYSGQELSLTKILGQLQESGSTVTLANYLQLLENAGMLSGLLKYSAEAVRMRKSSPRFMVFDTSLMTYASNATPSQLEEDPEWKGHLVESAVGAYLLSRSMSEGFSVNYWRDRDAEVDFVLTKGERVTAIEVKSGRAKGLNGYLEFKRRHPDSLTYAVGSSNMGLEDFLLGKFPLFKN